MVKRKGYKKTALAVVFFVVFGVFSSNALASDNKVNWSISFSSLPDRHGPKHEEVSFRGKRYQYHDGKFYRPGLLGISFILPSIGVIVKSIPVNSRAIIVNRDKYYCYNDVYYRSCHQGYIVVPAPKVNTYVKSYAAKQPDISTGTKVVVNIPNANGTYTVVNLTKQADGYIGPQGEYYPEHPTVEQLIALYGK